MLRLCDTPDGPLKLLSKKLCRWNIIRPSWISSKKQATVLHKVPAGNGDITTTVYARVLPPPLFFVSGELDVLVHCFHAFSLLKIVHSSAFTHVMFSFYVLYNSPFHISTNFSGTWSNSVYYLFIYLNGLEPTFLMKLRPPSQLTEIKSNRNLKYNKTREQCNPRCPPTPALITLSKTN